MIHALIVDLDNTLFPTESIPAAVVQPVIDALVAANAGPNAVSPETLYRVIDECWRRPFDLVALEHSLPPSLQEAWATACLRLTVQVPLTPYPDVTALSRLPVRRFLVTTGYRQLQESKVTALGIRALVEAVHVDAVDEQPRRGKEPILREIMQGGGWKPAEVLVLGDSEESEIAAGNRIGMPTVQILRDGVTPAASARFWIRSLEELPGIVQQLR